MLPYDRIDFSENIGVNKTIKSKKVSYFSVLVFIRSDDINNVAFLYISGADIIVVLFLE